MVENVSFGNMKNLSSLLLLFIVSLYVNGSTKKPLLFNDAANAFESSLVSFESHLNGERVDITWETKNQTDVISFTVEKSRDGIHYEPIFEVGTTKKPLAYMDYFNVDFDLWEGKTYYRIIERNKDGFSLESNIVAVVDNERQERLENQISERSFSFDSVNNNGTEEYKADREPTAITERAISLDGLLSPEPVDCKKESLVVLRNRKGEELYAMVSITNKNDKVITGYDDQDYVPEGKYLIIGSSSNDLYGKKLLIRKW